MNFAPKRHLILALILALIPAILRAEQGLMAHYTFDEGSGAVAGDSSGNGNAGTLIGSPAWTTGIKGGALNFNGSTDYIEIPFAASMNTPVFTVAAWVKCTGGGSYRCVFCNRALNPLHQGSFIYAHDSGQWTYFVGNNATGYNGIFGPAVSVNSWTFLCAVYDGTQMLYYIGNDAPRTLTIAYDFNTSRPFRIGAGATEGAPAHFFTGLIDDVRVYDRALSLAEINTLRQVPPVAAADSYSCLVDRPRTIAAPGVLSNDADSNGDTLTAVKDTNPSHGTLILNSNGSFTYTPENGFTGDDSFTYHANDGKGNDSASATVTISVTGMPAGLSLWYKFDEGTGTTANDSSTNGNTGTLNNGTTWATGVLSSSTNFDGSNDQIRVSRNSTIEPAGGITVAMWGRITNASPGQFADLLRKAAANSDGYLLRWTQNDGRVQFRIGKGSTVLRAASPAANSTLINKWHHYAGTYDAGTSTCRLYIDGVQVASNTGTIGTLSHTDDLYLMYQNFADQTATPGRLDDVMVYSRALAAGEISLLAQPAATMPTVSSNVNAPFRTNAQSVNLSAAVATASSPVTEGTLTFQIKNGAANVGAAVTVNVTNGTADGSYLLPAGTPLGIYTIEAAYNGSAAFAPSFDNSKSLTVELAPTTLAAVNSAVGFSGTDQLATLNATVTSAAGTVNEGNVVFQVKNGATNIGSSTGGPVTNGAASISYTIPAGTPLGTYTVEVNFTGTNFAGSSDNTHTLRIVEPNSMSAEDAFIPYKAALQNVTLNAIVTGAAGTVNEGTVKFQIKNGAANVGTETTSLTVANGSVSVSYTLPPGTPAGTYSIFASYSGGPNFPPGSDNTKTLTITKAATGTTPSNATAPYSFTDQTASISVQVTSSAGVVNEGTVTVQLKSGAQNLGTAVTSNPITNGSATISYTIPGGTLPGTYSIQAAYSGGVNFAAGSDASKTLTVLKATPVIVWPNPADIAYGTALGAAQLNAGTGGIPGTFVYNPALGTLLSVGNAQQLSVAFTPNDTTNYNSAQKNVTINVTRKTLTVTADNKTKLFGSPNPPLTASYSGFVDGDTAAVLTGAPTLSTSVTTSTPPGNYPITITTGTLNAANYSFTFINGTLTVSNTPAFFNLSGPNVPYGTPTTTLSGKISFGVTGAVSITFNGVTKSATVDASGAFSADFTTQTVELGTYPIQYFYPGSGSIGSASDSKTLTIIKATPALTWSNPADIPYGTQLSGAQLNATANVAGAFAYTPLAGTVLAKGTHQLSTAFTPTDGAHYISASASVTLVVGLAEAVVTWASPADISYGTALSETQLNATADIAGTFAYNPPSGTILDAGGQQRLSLVFTPNDNVNYAISQVDVYINVLKADQSITFAQIAAQEIGSPALILNAAASSNLPVTFTLVSGNATLQGGTLTLTGLGAITLRAEQAGDSNYNAAPTLEQTFHVIIVPPHLTSALSASGTQGQAFAFTLTAGGTQPVTFESAALPPGLALNANTGEISGTPTASGAFQIAVTARNGGGTETKTLTLVFASSGGGGNQAPKFTSGALATPNPATINLEVGFTASAGDEDGDAVAIVWDFGDGTQGFGPAAPHRYTAAGIFAVRVTITDGVASDYLNMTVVVNGSAIPPDQFKQYVVSKLGLKFNFAKPNTDSLSISGTIPIPAAFSPADKVIKFKSAELQREWTLDKKAASADKAFKLTGKFAKDGTFTASPAKFALALKNQDLFAGLSPLGFINDNTPKGMVVQMPVILVLEGTGYLATVDVKYSAKKGKSGAGKK